MKKINVIRASHPMSDKEFFFSVTEEQRDASAKEMCCWFLLCGEMRLLWRCVILSRWREMPFIFWSAKGRIFP